MRRAISVALLILIAAAVAAPRAQPQASAGRALTIEDYYRIQTIGAPSISPNGRWVTFGLSTRVEEDNSTRNEAWLVPSDGSAQPHQVQHDGRDVSNARWADDGWLEYTVTRQQWKIDPDRPSVAPIAVESAVPDGRGSGGRGRGAGSGIRVPSPDGRWIAQTREKAQLQPDTQYASDFEKRQQERFKGAIFDWKDFQRDGQPFPAPDSHAVRSGASRLLQADIQRRHPMAPLSRLATSVAVVISLVLVHGSTPTGPVKLTKAAADAAIKEIERDRADTQKWLRTDPTSYLAAIARQDFGGRSTLTVGSAADNDVRVGAPDVTAHHLRVTVDGDKFRVEAVDSQARFTIQAKEPGKNAVRNATIGPSYIEIGRLSLRLSHQGFPAIIVFDPQSPRFKAYKGLRFFPVDLAYRYELELTPNPKPETTIIMSTRGNQRRAMRVGWFDFMVGGVPYRLEVDRLLEPGVGENDVSIFFRDATTGKETYSVGRYLDAVKLPNGRYLVDFNNAYNPACAVSDFYNCPIPLPANTLKVAIRAGEMDAHYH